MVANFVAHGYKFRCPSSCISLPVVLENHGQRILKPWAYFFIPLPVIFSSHRQRETDASGRGNYEEENESIIKQRMFHIFPVTLVISYIFA